MMMTQKPVDLYVENVTSLPSCSQMSRLQKAPAFSETLLFPDLTKAK